MMNSVRAVIADDHPLFREGLQALLEDLGVTVVGSVGDGLAALDAVRRHDPDVVLMDLRMPGLGGVEATARINRDHPRTAVLVLTMSGDAASLQAALHAGARGYLLKETSKDDVARTLDAVLRGQTVVGAGLAMRVRNRVSGVLAKMQVHTRAEANAVARDEGLGATAPDSVD